MGFFLRLFNADGSEAELSGNGTRCVAAWLAQSEGMEEVALGTHGGVRTLPGGRRQRAARIVIESGMGVPRVMPRTIVVRGSGRGGGGDGERGESAFCVCSWRPRISGAWAELAGAGREDQHEPAVSAWDQCGVCAGAVGGRDCVSDL